MKAARKASASSSTRRATSRGSGRTTRIGPGLDAIAVVIPAKAGTHLPPSQPNTPARLWKSQEMGPRFRGGDERVENGNLSPRIAETLVTTAVLSKPRDLTRLLSPRSVAIVGASPTPGALGNSVL